jgi:hypothetical protein
MTPFGYRLWRGFKWFALGLVVALYVALMFGCLGCAGEAQTAKGAGLVAAGSAGGSLFGPVGAAIGGGLMYLFGAASAATSEVQHLGFCARLGGRVDSLIWWCLAGYLLVLFLVPKSRDNLLAMFSRGVPVLDRLKSLMAGLVPSPHSPAAALARKAQRTASRNRGPPLRAPLAQPPPSGA